MMIKNILKNLFTSNVKFIDTDGISYRRLIMINSMLSLSVLVFFSFSYFNAFYMHQTNIAVLDFIIALSSIATLLFLRKTKNISRAAFASTSILIIFMFLFILENKNSNFGIIWSIFIPFLAIYFNGKVIGLNFTLFFFSVMYTLAYTNIGIWNNGAWEFIDFIRYFVATSLITFLVYMSEEAHEEADIELAKVRTNEKKILADLQRLSITDGLTNIYNRRYFDEIAPKLLSLSERHTNALTLFILDIDYFKHYNDYYGHQQGDEVLKSVAKELLLFAKRNHDFVFRIGGEEFAGIVQSSKKEDNEKWIAQLTKRIEALNIEHAATLLPKKVLTVSVGVCTLQETSTATDIETLYKKADDALYKAKESGRNRTVFAP